MMLSTRVAARVATAGALAAATAVVVLNMRTANEAVERLEATPPPAAKRCTGWLPVVPSELRMLDIVRVTDDDAWLLTARGVFRWDGCAWRLVPSQGVANSAMEWKRLAVDERGTAWVLGVQPPMGRVRHGCILDYQFKGGWFGYRFDGATWQSVAPAQVPHNDHPAMDLAQMSAPPRGTVVAASGDPNDLWAILHVTRNLEVTPGGYARFEWTELWRRRDGAWTPSLASPSWSLSSPAARDQEMAAGLDRRDPARTFRSNRRWTDDRGEFWALGVDKLRHGRGSQERDVDLGEHVILHAVFGTSRSDIWVGGRGTWHFDGNRWEKSANDGMTINAFGGSGPEDVWAIGYDDKAMPAIRRWDGESWRAPPAPLPTPRQYHLTAVTSSGPDDAWVVGDWGVILHWDGVRWTELPPPTLFGFSGVALEAGELYVGDDHSLYRYVKP